MGESSGFSEYNQNFKLTSLTIFLGHLWESEKKSVVGKFFNLKLNTRLPTKKDTKIRR